MKTTMYMTLLTRVSVRPVAIEEAVWPGDDMEPPMDAMMGAAIRRIRVNFNGTADEGSPCWAL